MAVNENITVIERFTAIAQLNDREEPVMTLRMSEFLEALTIQVNQSIILSGTGSPEGVLTQQPFKMYLDTAAPAGSNLYIKKTGTGATGWVLV